MTILNVDSEVEYFIQSMLERQFAGENMFHLLVRYASLPDYNWQIWLRIVIPYIYCFILSC